MDQNSARALVISAAKSNGFVLQPEAATAAAKALSGSVRFDAESGGYVPVDGEHRAFRVLDGKAVDIDLATHVIALARQHGDAGKRTEKPPISNNEPSSYNLTADMLEELRQRSSNARSITPEMLKGPNPWAKETFNLTRQMMIERADPQMAERLQQSVR